MPAIGSFGISLTGKSGLIAMTMMPSATPSTTLNTAPRMTSAQLGSWADMSAFFALMEYFLFWKNYFFVAATVLGAGLPAVVVAGAAGFASVGFDSAGFASP